MIVLEIFRGFDEVIIAYKFAAPVSTCNYEFETKFTMMYLLDKRRSID